MSKTGRPQIEIDWDRLDKLGQLQCTQEEISWFFEVSVDTLDRACKREKDKSFAEYLKEKRGKGRIRLRQKQMEMALNGNVPLLIFLGKQYLNQSDKVDSKTITKTETADKVIEAHDEYIDLVKMEVP
jgi:hypothetical protein